MSKQITNVKLPASFRTEGTPSSSAAMATSRLALGISTALLMPLVATAQDGTQPATATLPKVKVVETLDPNPNAEPGAPYKARTSGDERHTRPLAETPQNITVLTKTAIDDSGYTDLRAILDTQPGITLGTGENGNAFGDRYIIRGQEARSDTFVDGLRDPGMTIRESFAAEQIEISKGPNSSFAGRGTSGGAINMITKQATHEYNFTKAATAFGTDEHTRVTLDANHIFGEQFAVRANALYGYEEVPDRGPTDRERKGLAVSGLYTPIENLDVVVDYYGLRAEDNPDLGGYLTGTLPNRRPARNVPVYAQEQDFLESDVDTATARVTYRFTDNLRITNLTRKGMADNGYVVTGINATTTNANNPTGQYATAALSTHNGWQEVDYLANQTNLFLNQTLAGKEHEFIFSLEYTDHDVLNGVYRLGSSGQNCSTGTNTTLNGWCIRDANGNLVNGLRNIMNRRIARGTWDIDWNVKTTSLAVMDTVDLTDRWTVFAGVRGDHFDFDLATQNPNTLARAAYDYSDTLFNGHLGVTYKITPQGLVYVAYATAADINGGESDVTSAGYGGPVILNGSIASADPESSANVELGTKWNLLGEKLLFTAAVFQITKSDVMEGEGYSSVGTFNSAKSRVRGVEFGVVGNVTEQLTLQAGVTFMDAEVLRSATPANIGNTLANFADQTAAAQLKYEFTEQFAIGAAAKYESEKFAGQPDTGAALAADGSYSQPIPSYTVFDMFATYRFNSAFDARINVGNLTDKDYYLAGYRSGAFLYKGDARNVALTLNYEFK